MDYDVIRCIPSAVPDTLRRALLADAQSGTFQSGLKTAGEHNKSKKRNSVASDARLQEAANRLIGLTLAIQDVQEFAFVQRVSVPQHYRYDVGDHYDVHLDRPLSYGIRTDLTYTLFLSSPEDYGGGELCLGMDFDFASQVKIKPAAGTLLLYDTGHPHRVAEVTSGSRHVLVGWIESQFRDAAVRGVLRNLYRVLRLIEEDNPDRDKIKLYISAGICGLTRRHSDGPIE